MQKTLEEGEQSRMHNKELTPLPIQALGEAMSINGIAIKQVSKSFKDILTRGNNSISATNTLKGKS